MRNQAIRLVTWNIEKGKRWSFLERCLETESIRSADIFCLQEVDDGTSKARTLYIGLGATGKSLYERTKRGNTTEHVQFCTGVVLTAATPSPCAW